VRNLRSLGITLLLCNGLFTLLLQTVWAAAEGETAKVRDLPRRLETWSGRDLTISPLEVELLRTRDYVFRYYRPLSGGRGVQLLVTWSANDLEAVHPSDDCYTAAGWDLVGRRVASLEIGGYGPLEVILKEVRKGTSTHLFFDLFRRPDGWSPRIWSHLWYLLGRTLTRRDPSGGKIRLDTEIGPGGRRRAVARLEEFLTLLMPRLERRMR